MMNDPQYEISVDEVTRKIINHPDVLKRDADFAGKIRHSVSLNLTLADYQTILNLAYKYNIIKVSRFDW